MNLTFEKDALLTSLEILESVTSAQHTLPILSNVLIHAKDNRIECCATDSELSIRTRVDGTVTEDGEITVSAKHLTDIVRVLPVGTSLQMVKTEDGHVEITCTEGFYKLVGMPADDFPMLPLPTGMTQSLTGETLCSLIHKTAFAAEGSRVDYLKGLYFNLLEDRTEVVATNGQVSLALAQCEPLKLLATESEQKGFIVPLKAAYKAAKTFADASEVTLCLVDNQRFICLADDDTTLTALLIRDDYPQYQRVIPEHFTSSILVNRERLLSAAQRVSVLSEPNHFPMKLTIEARQLHLSSNTQELGEALETLALEASDGDVVNIGLNARFLIKTLSHINAASISLKHNDFTKPVLLKPADADDHICLVMPMQLESAGN